MQTLLILLFYIFLLFCCCYCCYRVSAARCFLLLGGPFSYTNKTNAACQTETHWQMTETVTTKQRECCERTRTTTRAAQAQSSWETVFCVCVLCAWCWLCYSWLCLYACCVRECSVYMYMSFEFICVLACLCSVESCMLVCVFVTSTSIEAHNARNGKTGATATAAATTTTRGSI